MTPEQERHYERQQALHDLARVHIRAARDVLDYAKLRQDAHDAAERGRARVRVSLRIVR